MTSPRVTPFRGLCHGTIAVASLAGLMIVSALSAGEVPPVLPVKLEIVPGHPWRPPFGLDRVGRPPDALVTYVGPGQPQGQFLLVTYRQENEVSRRELTWIISQPPRPPTPIMARVSLADGVSRVVLLH
ncbi:MAG: hypothetical protein PHR35_17570, partial [Kiritimatiellae bacterium]|nr:hypothetical protein [Kiritimatiellia bacterium]